MVMIEQLVAKTFATRNAAHLQHWRTKSYAEHNVDVKQVSPANITTHLAKEVMWLNEYRSKWTKGLPALENLMDSITDLYLSTIYKLKNLS